MAWESLEMRRDQELLWVRNRSLELLRGGGSPETNRTLSAGAGAPHPRGFPRGELEAEGKAGGSRPELGSCRWRVARLCRGSAARWGQRLSPEPALRGCGAGARIESPFCLATPAGKERAGGGEIHPGEATQKSAADVGCEGSRALRMAHGLQGLAGWLSVCPSVRAALPAQNRPDR